MFLCWLVLSCHSASFSDRWPNNWHSVFTCKNFSVDNAIWPRKAEVAELGNSFFWIQNIFRLDVSMNHSILKVKRLIQITKKKGFIHGSDKCVTHPVNEFQPSEHLPSYFATFFAGYPLTTLSIRWYLFIQKSEFASEAIILKAYRIQYSNISPFLRFNIV